MALISRARRLLPASEPNVIPFIDVLLVLLIIFMVTAPIPTSDLRIDLPPPNPRFVPLLGQTPTIVALRETSAGAAYFVDERAVRFSELGAGALERALHNNPGLDTAEVYAEARVVLRADQSTAYANVVDVMSALQEAGFVKVSIFSERAAEG